MLSSRKGQVLQSVLLLAIVTLAGGFMATMTIQQARQTKKKKQDIEFGIQIQTGIETMLLAYRMEEVRYIEALMTQGCETANPFLRALKEGSACANSSGPRSFSLTVFSTGQNKASTEPLFFFAGNGCQIDGTSSTCKEKLIPILDIGMVAKAADPKKDIAKSQIIGGVSYEFFLNTVFPEKSIAEFVSHIHIEGSNNQLQRSFAIRPVLPNAAHLEADGRVVQESPDPLARCQGEVWADFLFFHPEKQQCQRFVNLGSGTGLAYYKGRYFGFRPTDGQVVDMFKASDTAESNYMVSEAGQIGTEKLFPCYQRAPLINVDDLTVVGNQLYYVAFSSDSAHIGVLDNTDCNAANFNRIKVCDLGSMGWSQAYSGIGALTWSDELIALNANDRAAKKLAFFFLKTDGGDFLTAVVKKKENSSTTPTASDYSCFIFKDQNLQQDEYKRTLGFDRTSDSKPYFIY